MEALRKQLLDEFCYLTVNSYREYCLENNLQQDTEGLITYLIDHEFIKASTIRHYAVQQKYTRLLPEMNNHKSKTVSFLAKRYNLSERSVWSAVKSQKA